MERESAVSALSASTPELQTRSAVKPKRGKGETMKLTNSLIRLLSIILLTTLILAADPPPPASAASITVNTLSDSDFPDGYCSLREAIIAARYDTPYQDCTSGAGDDLITFSVSGTIHLTSALTEISYIGTPQALTIDGGNNIIIDGDSVAVCTV